MELKIGTLLQGDKYKIVRSCGQGGFGITYEGEQKMLGRVAIKEFYVKDFCDRDQNTNAVFVTTKTKIALVDSLEKKFYKEAKSIFKLHHNNIVRVTDVFKENGTTYYVMDYINGSTLAKQIENSPNHKLEEDVAISYFKQICDALQYIHSKKVLHLDIKPENILIDTSSGDNRAILIDFGVSKQYDEVNGENNSTLLGMSSGYAPIEQMENTIQHFMPATDIYALGATYYKMVTGKNPPTISDIIMSANNISLPKNLNAVSKTIIRNCMQLNAKDRPQDIEAVLSLLDDKSFISTLKKWNISFAKKDSDEKEIKKDDLPSELDEVFLPSADDSTYIYETNVLLTGRKSESSESHLSRNIKASVPNKPLKRKRLYWSIGAVLFVLSIGCIVYFMTHEMSVSTVEDNSISKPIQSEKTIDTMSSPEEVFAKNEFEDLVKKADADAELDDDLECLTTALDNYNKALRLNPPADLKAKVEQKIKQVKYNISKLKRN